MTTIAIIVACFACVYAGLFVGGWCRDSKLDSAFRAGRQYERRLRQQASCPDTVHPGQERAS